MEILQFRLLLASLPTHFCITPVLTNTHLLECPSSNGFSVYAYHTHTCLHQGIRPEWID